MGRGCLISFCYAPMGTAAVLVGLLFSQSSSLMELHTLVQGRLVWGVLSPALSLCHHRHFPPPFPHHLTGFHHQHRFIPRGSC